MCVSDVSLSYDMPFAIQSIMQGLYWGAKLARLELARWLFTRRRKSLGPRSRIQASAGGGESGQCSCGLLHLSLGQTFSLRFDCTRSQPDPRTNLPGSVKSQQGCTSGAEQNSKNEYPCRCSPRLWTTIAKGRRAQKNITIHSHKVLSPQSCQNG